MPSPQVEKIILSERQQALLKQIVRRTTNPYRLVRRAQLILWAAAGVSNSQLTTELKLDRGQVRLWRERWLGEHLTFANIRSRRQDRQTEASGNTSVERSGFCCHCLVYQLLSQAGAQLL